MKSYARIFGSLMKCLLVASPLLFVMALFYPVIAKEQEMRKNNTCQSNLKSLAMAFNQYVDDYDKVAPQAGRNLSPGTSWGSALEPYMYTAGMLQCPPEGIYVERDILQTTHAVCYYLNANLSLKKVTAAKAPESTLLFGEGESASSNYACFNFSHCIGLNDYSPVGPVPDSAKTRHYFGANYVFVDGHVKWIMPKNIAARLGKDVNYSFALR